MGTGSFPGVKDGRGVTMTSSLADAEVKRAWRIISTRLYTFAARY